MTDVALPEAARRPVGGRRRVTSPPPDRFDRRLTVPMILGSLLNPVNSSMLAVALVPIGVALGAPSAQTVWLVTALYLATAVGQPVVGRLVDLLGPRTLYLMGAALVGVAGVLGALAPTLGVLVVARVLIGLGTCAGYPAAMYLLRTEGRRTGRDNPSGVLAALAISVQVMAVVGPTLGGALVGLGGWRAVFTVNVPLALACLVLGWRRLPTRADLAGYAPLAPTGGPRAVLRRLDPLGVVLFAGALVAVMLLLVEPRASLAVPLVLGVVAVALGAGFVRRELRAADPFVDLRVLGGNGPLVRTYVRQVLAYTVSYSFLYGFTQWLEAGRGLDASQAGLVLLPMFAVSVGVTALWGRTPSLRSKLLVGAGVQVVACAALLLLGASTAVVWLVVLTAVLGVPQGLVGLVNQNALYRQADPARTGSSAGLLRTCTYLGALVSSAATATFFRRGADAAGLHELGVFTAGCALVLLVVALVDRSLGPAGRARTA